MDSFDIFNSVSNNNINYELDNEQIIANQLETIEEILYEGIQAQGIETQLKLNRYQQHHTVNNFIQETKNWKKAAIYLRVKGKKIPLPNKNNSSSNQPIQFFPIHTNKINSRSQNESNNADLDLLVIGHKSMLHKSNILLNTVDDSPVDEVLAADGLISEVEALDYNENNNYSSLQAAIDENNNEILAAKAKQQNKLEAEAGQPLTPIRLSKFQASQLHNNHQQNALDNEEDIMSYSLKQIYEMNEEFLAEDSAAPNEHNPPIFSFTNWPMINCSANHDYLVNCNYSDNILTHQDNETTIIQFDAEGQDSTEFIQKNNNGDNATVRVIQAVNHFDSGLFDSLTPDSSLSTFTSSFSSKHNKAKSTIFNINNLSRYDSEENLLLSNELDSVRNTFTQLDMKADITNNMHASSNTNDSKQPSRQQSASNVSSSHHTNSSNKLNSTDSNSTSSANSFRGLDSVLPSDLSPLTSIKSTHSSSQLGNKTLGKNRSKSSIPSYTAANVLDNSISDTLADLTDNSAAVGLRLPLIQPHAIKNNSAMKRPTSPNLILSSISSKTLNPVLAISPRPHTVHTARHSPNTNLILNSKIASTKSRLNTEGKAFPLQEPANYSANNSNRFTHSSLGSNSKALGYSYPSHNPANNRRVENSLPREETKGHYNNYSLLNASLHRPKSSSQNYVSPYAYHSLNYYNQSKPQSTAAATSSNFSFNRYQSPAALSTPSKRSTFSSFLPAIYPNQLNGNDSNAAETARLTEAPSSLPPRSFSQYPSNNSNKRAVATGKLLTSSSSLNLHSNRPFHQNSPHHHLYRLHTPAK
jgi:hypothetical protein